jgi:hypothetical protein
MTSASELTFINGNESGTVNCRTDVLSASRASTDMHTRAALDLESGQEQ